MAFYPGQVAAPIAALKTSIVRTDISIPHGGTVFAIWGEAACCVRIGKALRPGRAIGKKIT